MGMKAKIRELEKANFFLSKKTEAAYAAIKKLVMLYGEKEEDKWFVELDAFAVSDMDVYTLDTDLTESEKIRIEVSEKSNEKKED